MQKIEFPRNYVVWDLETTGLVPKTDRVLEIAAINVVNGTIVQEYTTLLNFNIDIPEHATAIHGITREMCEKSGNDPLRVFNTLYEMLMNAPACVTHNGHRFDIPFLLADMARVLDPASLPKLEERLRTTHIDTASLYKAQRLEMVRGWNEPLYSFTERVMSVMAKGVKYSVDHCCDNLGIDRSTVQQHRALGDVKLTNEMYRKLCLE